MNKVLSIVIAAVVLLTFLPTKHVNAQNEYVSYQDFFDNLGPYGQWIKDPQYGYAWIPYAEEDFRPYYTNGYWIMTDYGNTWVSEYPWGWATFHYGRWLYDAYYGWLWIPGNEWGPAWVSWRYGDGYYGWAPLAPGFEINNGFDNYYCPDDWWVFLPPRYLYRPRYYNYWRGPDGNPTIIRRTSPVNNTFINPNTNGAFVSGPRADDIQQLTGQTVRMYHIQAASKPISTRVNGDVVSMYRPATVQTNMANGSAPAPNNMVNAPQPVGQPQAVGVNGGQRPVFRIMNDANNNENNFGQPRGFEQPTSPMQNMRGYQQPNAPVQQQNNQVPQPPVQRQVPPPPQPPVRMQQQNQTVPQQQNNTPQRHG